MNVTEGKTRIKREKYAKQKKKMKHDGRDKQKWKKEKYIKKNKEKRD